MSSKGYSTSKLSLQQIAMGDVARLGLHTPYMFYNYEFDVSQLRKEVRENKREHELITSAVISKIIVDTCCQFPQSLSLIGNETKLYNFDHADVFMPIKTKSKEVQGWVFKKWDTKSASEITREINEKQNSELPVYSKAQEVFLKAPRWFRDAYYKRLKKQPLKYKSVFGNLLISFVYGDYKWALTRPIHTVGIYIGSINTEGKMPFCVCVNHEVSDGQDFASGFFKALKYNIENYTFKS